MKYLLYLCSFLLFVAIFEMPIGYYTFLRIVVFAGSIMVIYNEYEGKITGWIITFGIIGVLFNPIIPVYLHDKVIWIVIDIVAAIIFTFKAIQTQSD